jgi:hypothetical protein
VKIDRHTTRMIHDGRRHRADNGMATMYTPRQAYSGTATDRQRRQAKETTQTTDRQDMQRDCETDCGLKEDEGVFLIPHR